MKLNEFLIEHRGKSSDITTKNTKLKLIYFFEKFIDMIEKTIALPPERIGAESSLNLDLADVCLSKFLDWETKKVPGGTFGIEAENLFIEVINVFSDEAKAKSLRGSKKSDIERIAEDLKGNISASGLSIKFYGEDTPYIGLGKTAKHKKDIINLFLYVFKSLIPTQKQIKYWKEEIIKYKSPHPKGIKISYDSPPEFWTRPAPKYYKRINNPIAYIISELKKGKLGRSTLEMAGRVLEYMGEKDKEEYIKIKLKSIMSKYTRTIFEKGKYYDTDYLISKVENGDFILALISKEEMTSLLSRKVMMGFVSFDTTEVSISFDDVLNFAKKIIRFNPKKWIEILKKFGLEGIHTSNEKIVQITSYLYDKLLPDLNKATEMANSEDAETSKEGRLQIKEIRRKLFELDGEIKFKTKLISVTSDDDIRRKISKAISGKPHAMKNVRPEGILAALDQQRHADEGIVDFAKEFWNKIYYKISSLIKSKSTNLENIKKAIEETKRVIEEIFLGLKNKPEDGVMEIVDELNEKRKYEKRNLRFWREKMEKKRQAEERGRSEKLIHRSGNVAATSTKVSSLLRGLKRRSKVAHRTPKQQLAVTRRIDRLMRSK